jgi:hypothetical protein
MVRVISYQCGEEFFRIAFDTCKHALFHVTEGLALGDEIFA